ncbi:2,3-bisphosphoglycerate-dependent phosphoglycerate mutase [Marchantia polymorpha subsp. ruderalis]|uniref:phosphoglycerate mutase (2,3-diphosphoglycerate-dependent) n=2 Tax=Marchantia polymorpha TaxID=3197 RepID=A0AAF6AXG3_MARPO|nr:hypothetical protein MARPO_0022s0059 [Marchantia polymorpha]BBN04447.1 hypothetical protein Mp_3g04700 [Marchantia polymorpha subsp. ruderalis]|eukprot:PTQ43955.1 hypothetical protein MARPO_0022s0059 [Marchantia polymorpha]
MERCWLKLRVSELPLSASSRSHLAAPAAPSSFHRSLHRKAGLKSTIAAMQNRSLRAQARLPGASSSFSSSFCISSVSSCYSSRGSADSAVAASVDDLPDARERDAELVGNVQAQLVLMRHGESMWNDLKLFTGDVDIPLTEKGVMEALAGGKAVSEVDFDIIFTSRLVRSKQTALIAMTQSKYKRVPVLIRGGYYGNGKTGDENRLRLRDAAANALEHASCLMVPVYADPALNERCYGDLQGLSKDAANEEFGEALVQKWRRSHDTRPPNGETLQDTYRRTTVFFEQTIEARLKEGKNVLVVAHGNVLRCIITHLSGLSIDEMLALQVATALPYAYAYNGHCFAQHCLLPPTHSDIHHSSWGWDGTASASKKGDLDSLI